MAGRTLQHYRVWVENQVRYKTFPMMKDHVAVELVGDGEGEALNTKMDQASLGVIDHVRFGSSDDPLFSPNNAQSDWIPPSDDAGCIIL